MIRGRSLPLLLLAVLLCAAPLLANGGTVRISRARVGAYLVSVFSSPTPLRTGEVDISVLVQDSADAAVDVPVRVRAVPLGPTAAVAEPMRYAATRQQATNKLFKAAKFDVEQAGEWRFVVEVGPAEQPAGEVSFQSPVTQTTLLDRPYLMAALVLLPLVLLAWLLLGRDEEDEEASPGSPR